MEIAHPTIISSRKIKLQIATTTQIITTTQTITVLIFLIEIIIQEIIFSDKITHIIMVGTIILSSPVEEITQAMEVISLLTITAIVYSLMAIITTIGAIIYSEAMVLATTSLETKMATTITIIIMEITVEITYFQIITKIMDIIKTICLTALLAPIYFKNLPVPSRISVNSSSK